MHYNIQMHYSIQIEGVKIKKVSYHVCVVRDFLAVGA